jgi:RNA polymerase sigma-70 factor (ECF subfamily)
MRRADINKDTSDEALMSLVRQESELALNELMSRYKHKVFAFISRYVKDEDAAYDILQETFIRVYFKSATYNSNYKFSTWLYQVAINLCRDWGRKQKIYKAFSLDTPIGDDKCRSYHDILPDPSANVEDLTDFRKNLEALDHEIQKLPHTLKTALILFAVEGYSQERCAEMLGVTSKTVETRVYRARKILAEKIAKHF